MEQNANHHRHQWDVWQLGTHRTGGVCGRSVKFQFLWFIFRSLGCEISKFSTISFIWSILTFHFFYWLWKSRTFCSIVIWKCVLIMQTYFISIHFSQDIYIFSLTWFLLSDLFFSTIKRDNAHCGFSLNFIKTTEICSINHNLAAKEIEIIIIML